MANSDDKIKISDAGMRATLTYDCADGPGLTIDENSCIDKASLEKVKSLAWCEEMEEDDENFDDVFEENGFNYLKTLYSLFTNFVIF